MHTDGVLDFCPFLVYLFLRLFFVSMLRLPELEEKFLIKNIMLIVQCIAPYSTHNSLTLIDGNQDIEANGRRQLAQWLGKWMNN